MMSGFESAQLGLQKYDFGITDDYCENELSTHIEILLISVSFVHVFSRVEPNSNDFWYLGGRPEI